MHRTCQAAFDHREAGFSLPALAICAVSLVEALLHLPTVLARRWLGGRPAGSGGDERADAARLAGVAVVGLGIVTSIRQRRVQLYPRQRVVQEWHEAVGVDAGTAADEDTDQQMTLTVEGCL